MSVLLRNKTFIPPCRRLALGTCGRIVSITGRYFFLLVFLMYAAAQQQSHAQVASAKAANTFKPMPLAIGDKIPDELWSLPLQVVNHPQGKKTITLSEYKDKLIILDFWNTWCVPCIRNFPKLHALQNEFGDKIKVLAVTQEDSDKITRFFKTGAGKEHTYVNSVINDSLLLKYFPHISVPHIAWINPKGKVLNTTQGDDLTQKNIQAVLDDQKIQMVSKIDIDRNRPLFLSEYFNDSMILKTYSIFFKGYYPGLKGGGNLKKNKQGKIYRRQMTNLPMMDIYYPIIYQLFDNNGEQFNISRAIIEVKDPSLLNWILKPDSTFETTNLYSYELVVPKTEADSLFYYMLEDLNRYSDYTGTIEKRMVNCLVLIRTSQKDRIKSKGGVPNCTFPASPSILSNHKLSVMINMVSDGTPIKLPIVDETGYTENVDIEVSGVKDLASFKKELKKYDLDLLPAQRSLNMFVLKDK
ncbi:MAG: TlpA family protein disulfide reductase [Chitinophagaceae bacterium]|nr:TlpA family protein disulfide reductase [Chitinophagaceae bacterium]MCW5928216.1 TlpA family protein disulfide reductase [Chitinophagaceae bacterium]